MVSLQTALLPEAAASNKRPPCLSLVGGVVASHTTATSKKRRRDDRDDDDRENSRGEVVDGIELNFDAAPLPPEWQRCLDIQSGQIHYYNTRTHKRTLKDPRVAGEPAPAAEEADEDDSANCAPPGLDLELNLTFSPRRAVAPEKKRIRPTAAAPPPPPADRRHHRPAEAAAAEDSGREMVAGVCVRCHMLVMMCRANPACPNCKFLHPSSRAAPPPPLEPEPAPLKLSLQLLCCRD
ncbi:hypothetical protein HU200_025581 [Digitaria exilis]|uniref:WW domain-containing protein n=1 Tax=Digitaria exilis TaxID=1010633 RepID=A0A835C8Q1_9POAL|nr:hypothetical protein HU200_025581 [Digitaria exilis]CAB3496827.1 unnamed protein product [Digitaria exilis]